MKRHVTKNFVKAMFACFMLTLSMVTIPVCATAKPDAGSVAPCRLVTADVLDTYKSSPLRTTRARMLIVSTRHTRGCLSKLRILVRGKRFSIRVPR